ncbi:hypothetical protein ACH5RR_037859 [Cinchona calisaya]|uniref:Disease resistance protein At4g27190-like leucine-rich repeats domain-containing protein n=1 Tax=Cinchona calisaya TaxID=153742 RepID=A0ABD2YC45_9GENT
METESKIMLPEDIQELELKDCHGLGSCLTEDVFLLLNIQRGGSSLTRCVVKDCEGMKCILKSSSFKNERRPLVRNNSLCPALQNLELLELIKLPSLVELCEWESICGATLPCGTLSCLKSFCIHSCPSMTKLFTLRLLQHLQNLEVINISSCYQLEEIVVDDQEECTTSTSTPSSSNSSSILPKLRKLSLDDLPKLSNFYEGTIFCDSIERVVIRYCPNLKRLPFFFPTVAGQLSPPPTLKVIEILELEREWWESLEWVDAGMQVVLQPFVRFHNRIIIVTPRI